MAYLPIFVDMHERDCLVVGGGTIAASRVEALLEAGATVTLIAPELTATIGEMRQGRCDLLSRARVRAG